MLTIKMTKHFVSKTLLMHLNRMTKYFMVMLPFATLFIYFFKSTVLWEGCLADTMHQIFSHCTVRPKYFYPLRHGNISISVVLFLDSWMYLVQRLVCSIRKKPSGRSATQ